MTDTHCHLYMEDYGAERHDVVRRAMAAGVSRLVFPNVDGASIAPMRALHEAFPDNTVMAMGLHPTELGDDPSPLLDVVERELREGGYAAVGEIGIDLHFEDNPPLAAQQQAFGRQLRLAAELHLPVIIHSRDSRDEVLEVISTLQQQGVELPPLVFHSFTGTPDDVRAIRRVCDPYFGINGVVTFKNAPDVRPAVAEIGADRLLLETDAPWLAPVPHRGRRNESAYIPAILDVCAAQLGIAPAQLERITDSNAGALFFPSSSPIPSS